MDYLTEQDREHALRKLAYHRVVARCLRGHKGHILHALAHEALDELEAGYGRVPFVTTWRSLLEEDRLEIARKIVQREDGLETMRETSPFMRIFGFDMGHSMPIVFNNHETRTRMWKLAKAVANVRYRDDMPPPSLDVGVALRM
jgi:hypothetical protein